MGLKQHGKQMKEKGIWVVYDLKANRKIQHILSKEGFSYTFHPTFEVFKHNIPQTKPSSQGDESVISNSRRSPDDKTGDTNASHNADYTKDVKNDRKK